MIRTYKTRAVMSSYAHRRLDEVLAMLCILYNAALEERKGAWNTAKKSINLYDQLKSIPYIREDDINYKNIHSSVLRSPLNRLDKAFQRFFKVGNHGFPRFKSIKRYRSFDINNKRHCNQIFRDNKLRIKGLPEIKLKYNGDLPDKKNLKYITVIRKALRVEVHLTYELPDAYLRESHNPVGVDVGISSLATLSTGEKFPRRRRKVQKLKRIQRMIARRRKGSNRRKKAVMMLRKEHQRIADSECNAMHRITSDLVKRFDGFAVEDLKIKKMTSKGKGKRGLNREILAQNWGTFIRLLEEKAESAGLPMVKVPAKNTTKACSQCGKIIEKTLSQRIHRCICGLEMDRDHNAALNILARGFPSTRVGNAVERPARALTYA